MYEKSENEIVPAVIHSDVSRRIVQLLAIPNKRDINTESRRFDNPKTGECGDVCNQRPRKG